ncbi:MAG TPA: GyrI-like domain-containing protein [Gemmatimonadales bacterium]|nr:GyrI-like domain-containing protein [Gemmatimonadales bacterium]
MIDPPEIADAEAQRAAVLRITIPRAEMTKVMGPAYGELMAAVTAQGIAVTGPWYSRHFRMDPDIFDFEIGVPVASAVVPAGRVAPGELPGGRVARTVFRGNYPGLGAAWGEFTRWIEAEGLAVREDLWERYVLGPEADRDPAAWRTELNRPLAG